MDRCFTKIRCREGRFEQHRSCWNLRSPPERMANKSHVVKHGQGEALLIDPFDFTRGKTKWTYQSRIDLIYYPPAHQDSTQELGLCIGTEQSLMPTLLKKTLCQSKSSRTRISLMMRNRQSAVGFWMAILSFCKVIWDSNMGQ